MDSMRSATRNTAFDRWLASTMSGPLGGEGAPLVAAKHGCCGSPLQGALHPPQILNTDPFPHL